MYPFYQLELFRTETIFTKMMFLQKQVQKKTLIKRSGFNKYGTYLLSQDES